jgi:hypothetical protein
MAAARSMDQHHRLFGTFTPLRPRVIQTGCNGHKEVTLHFMNIVTVE